MQSILEFGVRLIVALQGLGTWPILPMQFFSLLGTEDFFMLALPILYWCVDSMLGIQPLNWPFMGPAHTGTVPKCAPWLPRHLSASRPAMPKMLLLFGDSWQLTCENGGAGWSPSCSFY